ncbi:autophagy protein 16, interacts with Atg12p-Atg5p [Rhinocladiella similis]
MTTTWRDTYLTALQHRQKVEQANLTLYDYCTKLADEKADLQNKSVASQAQHPEDAAEQSPSVVQPSSYLGMGIRRVTSPAARPDSPTVAQIRQDLAKAQQERGDLQTRLEKVVRDLDALKAKAKVDSKRIAQLNASLSQITVKLRDKEEELRGKAKLIENVQDENVTLNLQLNMAEEQSDKLRRENKELVDRWMARMGKEADRMNEESKFG